MEQVKTAVFGTKRIRLTRSIMLAGKEAKEGEVQDLPIEVADDLIRMGSAIHCDAPVTRTEAPERKKETRQIKLLRSVVLGPSGDGEAGEVHEVPIHIAYSLIEDKAAEPHGWEAKPLDVPYVRSSPPRID